MENNNKKFDVVLFRLHKYEDGIGFDITQLDKLNVSYEKKDLSSIFGDVIPDNFIEINGSRKCKYEHCIEIGILLKNDRLIKNGTTIEYDCLDCKNICVEILNIGIYNEGDAFKCHVISSYLDNHRKGS
jgi:hypothetical protein